MDKMLNAMLTYGKPTLWYFDGVCSRGWICDLQLHAGQQYLAVKLKSEALREPVDAVAQCHMRLLELVEGKTTIYLEKN